MTKPRCVLIADDEAEIVGFVAEALRDEGYEVVTVSDGQNALRSIQMQQPDLVILDHVMPHMTGGEVLTNLRKNGYTLPIIMMSANAHAELFLLSGADAFLPKPFDLDRMLTLINQCLSNPPERES